MGEMKPSGSAKPYRTLDMVKAAAFGWTQHRGLSANETQVLLFIALRGKPNEPGSAYSWFPVGGQHWWADLLMMTHVSLRKTLSRLRQRGLLIDLSGSTRDSRFTAVRGYGIPTEVMQECVQWHTERRELVYLKIPNSLSDVTSGHTNVTDGNIYVTSGHIDVTDGNIHVTRGHTDNALTWGFPDHTRVETHVENPGETQLLTEDSPAANLTSNLEIKTMDNDDWGVEEYDGFDQPRDRQEAPKRRPAPVTRVMDSFYDHWKRSRESRAMLATPWSIKKIAVKNIGNLIRENSEEFVQEMVEVFFRLIDSGQIVLRSDELWRDFLFNRGRLEKLVRQRTPSAPADDDEAAELERYRRRLNQ